jgi:hypothetical protein
MKILLNFTFLSLFSFISIGQTVISASRPGQCISSSAINKGTLQLQTGIQYDFGNVRELEVPTTMLRYGLFNGFEIRLYEQLVKFPTSKLAFDNPELSILVNLTKGNKWVPEMAISPHVGYDFVNKSMSSGIILSGSNRLGNKFGYSFNLASNYQNDLVGYYALAFNYTYNKLTFFIETFGNMAPNDVRFDVGFGYLLNSNIQLDLYGGSDANLSSYFLSTGICVRLIQKKK